VAVALIGCERGTGEAAPERFACDCQFLTDTDHVSSQPVSVCAAATRVDAVARGCAQSAAPATVQGCACRATGEGCASESCEAKAER
jgi:hypothetical protein